MFAEMYALVFKGEIKGYRIYTCGDNNVEQYYDFQTNNTSLSCWAVNRIPLIQCGGYLVTKEELNGRCKPIQIMHRSSEFNELIKQVKYCFELMNKRG